MALNDPQWGRRGNDGPPDLDELWKRFRQKLPGVGGGKIGRDGGGGGSRQFRGGALLLIALVIIVWLASGFYIVDASQRGVVLRFGKYAQTTQPGPQWHLPYPIESVEVVNLSQVRTVEVGYRNNLRNKVPKESLMLTDDENIIDLQFAAQYILRDPTEYLFNNRNPDESVMQVAESAMREIVGKSKMDFVLYEGREQIAARAHKLMQQILDRYKTGISISKVTMQQAQPPEQVQAAFDDAVKAGQDRERQINEGQAYANDVVPKARGTASRLLQEAEGYRQRVVANAEGEAARFRQVQAEYSRAPAVTRERIYLETMQQIFANTTKVMVDQKASNNLLYLPLDKILQMTGSSSSGSSEASSGTPAPEAPSTQGGSTDTRSRDAFRSRDREARP
ncbi:MAG TPA: FtsH protease activity modulator HflK [Burkholderiales bacterium]|nr:FtsH protease activity modulator HflK [Burkholderiales bacterium]